MTNLSIERQGRIATVTFDRGTSSNLLSFSLMHELTDVAREFQDDLKTSAIILSGRNDNFCLGFDLKDPETIALKSASLIERRHAAAIGRRMCEAWENLEQLTISAIEGWCVGGGVALAVATDLRVISETGHIYVPEIERGLNMSWGSIPRIVNLIGPARAKRLVVLAEKLDSPTAELWGMVDSLCAPGAATEAALKFAERAADLPPVALRMAKRDINAYANALASSISHSDPDTFALARASADAEEGIAAFFEKRPAKFQGD